MVWKQDLQKWIKNGKQDLQPEESYGRISILQLTRSKTKKRNVIETWINKDGFEPRSRLDWKIVEAYTLNYF